MTAIRRSGIEFSNLRSRSVSTVIRQVAWDPVDTGKAGYRHYMLKEIFDQPSAVLATLRDRVTATRDAVDLELGACGNLNAINRAVVLASGTSWHAGLVGKFLVEALARLPVEVDYGSEYRFREPILDPGTLAVVITQSGKTADTLAALREARVKGAVSVAICDVVDSPATREAAATIHTHAGPEIGVASTKAFTTQVVAIHLLALHLARSRQTLSPDDVREQIASLTQLPCLIHQALQCDDTVARIATELCRRKNFLFIGRGINYPIALEGALKMKEVAHVHAEGYPAGEMKHGPIALIEEGLPVVTLLPCGPVFDKMVGNVQEAKARGATIVAVTDAAPGSLAELFDPTRDRVIHVPRTHPSLTPVLMTIPLQLLAYHIARLRGCHVDRPRSLAKSVTVE